MENLIIRQRREVTAMGITRVRELCAQGYIDQSGVVSADMGRKSRAKRQTLLLQTVPRRH